MSTKRGAAGARGKLLGTGQRSPREDEGPRMSPHLLNFEKARIHILGEISVLIRVNSTLVLHAVTARRRASSSPKYPVSGLCTRPSTSQLYLGAKVPDLPMASLYSKISYLVNAY